MEVNCETIKHLADLSDFVLDDTETEALTGDLQNIINYISQLDELDTENIEPTYQVFEMKNVWRGDEIRLQDTKRDGLLALTKEEKDNQLKVPKVL